MCTSSHYNGLRSPPLLPSYCMRHHESNRTRTGKASNGKKNGWMDVQKRASRAPRKGNKREHPSFPAPYRKQENKVLTMPPLSPLTFRCSQYRGCPESRTCGPPSFPASAAVNISCRCDCCRCCCCCCGRSLCGPCACARLQTVVVVREQMTNGTFRRGSGEREESAGGQCQDGASRRRMHLPNIIPHLGRIERMLLAHYYQKKEIAHRSLRSGPRTPPP